MNLKSGRGKDVKCVDNKMNNLLAVILLFLMLGFPKIFINITEVVIFVRISNFYPKIYWF